MNDLDTHLDNLVDTFKRDLIDDTTILSTGYNSLDRKIDGYRRGCITEIFGKEATAKTYLSLKAMKEVSDLGGLSIYIDSDNTFKEKYFEDFGIDNKSVILFKPEFGEDIIDFVYRITDITGVDLLIIDSITSVLPREGEDGVSHIKYVTKLVKKISTLIGDYSMYCIFTNQVRDDGSKQGTSTGGKILRFYTGLRLNTIGRRKYLMHEDEIIGETISIEIIKNIFSDEKIARDKTTIDIYYT